MTDDTKTKRTGSWREASRAEWNEAAAKVRETIEANDGWDDEGLLTRPTPEGEVDPFEKAVLDLLAEQKVFLNEHCMPKQPEVRKRYPVTTGFLDYFPMAVMEVANLSRIGNEQHNKGLPVHWSRGKSNDHADCLVRHLLCRGTFDTDGIRHSAKVAWRALALLQLELESEVYGE